MTSPFADALQSTLTRLRGAFRETARGARDVVGAPLRPDLPDDELPRLRARIDACLEGKGGETARRGRAAELGQAYLSLSSAGRRKFLVMLARDYGLSRDAAVSAVDRWRGSKEPARALVKSLEAPAVRVMREFVGVPQGVKFVVDLRAVLSMVGRIISFLSLAMLAPLGIALYEGQPLRPFAIGLVVGLVGGFVALRLLLPR